MSAGRRHGNHRSFHAATMAVATISALLAVASPASAKNAYISAPDARYYARDAVRGVHPDAFKVKASCSRKSRSLFKCDVSWVRSHLPRRYAKVRVRGLERNGESFVQTAFTVTHG